ncbi:MAG: extracellular solute-binding protein [Chloroflexota bacterium]|nr:extracellular solute-binding protein [Chloroflexota bacterium]
MSQTTRAWARLAALIASLAIVGAACSSTTAPGDSPSTGPGSAAPATASPTTEPSAGDSLAGQRVTVIGTWGGSEQDAFLAMVKPWESKTGATVKYTGTRDLNTVLTTGVASGVLPDLAGLPGPGQMAEWADSLVDLGGVLDMTTYRSETAEPLIDLGTVNGKTVGVFIKSAVKGLIWYNPSTVDLSAGAPATWDALQKVIADNKGKAAAPWCVGIESGGASGWAGTDWIEDFVLRQSGPDVYDQWWQGKVKWTDPAIKSAFETFGQVVANSYGGATAVNATNFANAGDPLFATPPGCLFHHQASFITGLGGFKTAPAGSYDFFLLPDMNTQFSGAVEGAGDLFGMFHDTPAAKSLMAYLVTAEAQDIWVKAGGALSANKNATSYPDEISKRSAELLQNAKIFAFDASDLMPSAMNSAFWSGVVKYVGSPAQLDAILADLDKTQADAYAQ